MKAVSVEELFSGDTAFSKEKREKYDAGFGTGDEPVPGLSAEVRSGPGAWKDGIL